MRRRLIIVALATTSMVALAFLVPLGLLVRNVARDRALTDAERDVQRLAPLLAVSDTPQEAVDAFGAASQPGSRITLYLSGGRRLGAPGPPATDESVRLARNGRSFTTDVDGGIALLSPVVLGTGRVAVVRVLVPDADLREGVVRSWLAIGAVGVVLVLIAVVVADRLAASIIRPVRRLADAARTLGSGDLSVRVEPAGPPEIAEVGGAFNLLADRVGELLAAERELVADLSHRLRTPLTALRLDADRAATGDAESAARILADVDALEAAVDGLIREARRPIRDEVTAPADLTEVVRDRAGFWAPLAEEQGREWSCACPDGSRRVRLGRDDVEAAVDALLGNVFAHTPDGTPYWVTVDGDERGSVLVVEDAGPGLPGGDVVERGRSGAGSTGLGLDIVRRTAESAGGELVAGARPGGGARIAVRFPAA